MENNLVIPNHIAIIMDGNGRWAKKRLLPRTAGHAKGSAVVEEILEDCKDLGVKYLTVYAFSTENWSRPEKEVTTLMNILRKYMKDSVAKCKKNNVRVRVIGDISKLSEDLIESIRYLEDVTKDYDGINFQIAINYGGRDEIRRASIAMAKDCVAGKLDPDTIDEATFEKYLDTHDIPSPDLLIRTSGEIRTSNFLPWQIAYSEFYFTDVLWPDFNKKELIKAIENFNKKERRFGGVK